MGILETAEDTARSAAMLAPVLRAGDVVALNGDLGTGKTVFARSLIHTLYPGAEVPSPTFNLVLTYEPEDPAAPAIWHFDLYRLDAPEDAIELGIEDAFDDAISLIEWPERLEHLLPDRRVDMTLLVGAHEGQRLIEIQVPEDWSARFMPTLKAMGLEPARDGEIGL